MVQQETGDTSWAFLTYPLDAPAAAFSEFEPIIELWRAKRPNDCRWPAWRGFDIMDFEGWWGQVGMGTIVSEHSGVNFILWGTKLTEWWCTDLTGKDIFEISILGSPAYEEQIDYYKAISAGGLIGFRYGTMESMYRPHMNLKVIELPLSSDGVAPSHILTVAVTRLPTENPVPSLEPVPLPVTVLRGNRKRSCNSTPPGSRM